MKKLLIAIFIAFLIFGCLNFGGNPPSNPVNSTQPNNPANTTPNKTVEIIIQPPKNNTQAHNATLPNQTNENTTPVQNTSQPWPGPTYNPSSGEKLGVYFLPLCDQNSGNQSAAILVKKGDFDMLIDAGSAATASDLVAYLHEFGIDDIDVFVSTADDPGRYGGIQTLINNFPIEEFWWSGQALTPKYKSAVDSVSSAAKHTKVVKVGNNFVLNGIKFDVLNPNKNYYQDKYNDAVVLRIEDRNSSVLLLSNSVTGELSYLQNNYLDKIKVDVMEAPYYGLGSATQSIGPFLMSTKPDYIVIEGCSDDNVMSGSAREPFRRMLNMEQYKIPYVETYKNGIVRVIIDGTGYAVTSGN